VLVGRDYDSRGLCLFKYVWQLQGGLHIETVGGVCRDIHIVCEVRKVECNNCRMDVFFKFEVLHCTEGRVSKPSST
jgi:hypothetical protein